MCQAVQPMGSGDCYVSSPQLLHPVPRAWVCDECFPPEPLPQPGSFHCCFTAESLDSGMVSVNCHPGRICNHLGHGPLEMPAGGYYFEVGGCTHSSHALSMTYQAYLYPEPQFPSCPLSCFSVLILEGTWALASNLVSKSDSSTY